MRYLSSDNQSYWLSAQCSLTQQVGEDSRPHIQERCVTPRGEFTILFWLGAQGEILRSKQWIAPEIGYFELAVTRQPEPSPSPQQETRHLRQIEAPR